MKKTIKRFILFTIAFAFILAFGISEKASAKDITIKKTKYVADSLNGVDALYRPGSSDGSNSTYSCAAYVKRYYREIHGKTITNLLPGRTPIISDGDRAITVDEPMVGDIVRERLKTGSTHWSIVKEVTEDGEVIVIEQNFKWRSGGVTYARVGREVDVDSGRITFFRLSSVQKELDKAEAEIEDAIKAAKIQ